jgi:hypothetical protein
MQNCHRLVVGVDFAQGFHLAIVVPMLEMMRRPALTGARDALTLQFNSSASRG